MLEAGADTELAAGIRTQPVLPRTADGGTRPTRGHRRLPKDLDDPELGSDGGSAGRCRVLRDEPLPVSSLQPLVA